MGFHPRGEMGGIWTPPLKLLDGIWFGVDGAFREATTFTSGHGYVRMDVPVRRTGARSTGSSPTAPWSCSPGAPTAPRGHSGATFTTTVTAHVPVSLRFGATLPAGARVAGVRLDGLPVNADTRTTNRGLGVTVPASPGAEHTLVVTTR